MEKRRLKLHSMLKKIVPNVYFQPPETLKLKYPAIVYFRTNVQNIYAENCPYVYNTRYDAELISTDSTGKYTNDIIKLGYTSYDRHFVKDNLHHDVFTIFI